MDKVITDSRQFVNELQSTFGSYKPGMIKVFDYQLFRLDIDYDRLFEHISRNWSKSTAPLMADVIALAKDIGIYIKRKNTEKIINICEFCYYGIQLLKNKRGRMVPDNVDFDQTKWPRKIVEINEHTNWQCPVCFNMISKGLCKKVK